MSVSGHRFPAREHKGIEKTTYIGYDASQTRTAKVEIVGRVPGLEPPLPKAGGLVGHLGRVFAFGGGVVAGLTVSAGGGVSSGT